MQFKQLAPYNIILGRKNKNKTFGNVAYTQRKSFTKTFVRVLDCNFFPEY